MDSEAAAAAVDMVDTEGSAVVLVVKKLFRHSESLSDFHIQLAVIR